MNAPALYRNWCFMPRWKRWTDDNVSGVDAIDVDIAPGRLITHAGSVGITLAQNEPEFLRPIQLQFRIDLDRLWPITPRQERPYILPTRVAQLGMFIPQPFQFC